ncbi:hypothetical protein NMG60_11003651 [Bertholletia excelsa]
MAINIVGAIAGKVAEFLFLPIKEEFAYLYSWKKNINKLQDHIQGLGRMRRDVEDEVERDVMNLCAIKPTVDRWLKEVDGAMKEAEMITKGTVESETRCLKGWCPNVKLRHSVSKKAKKMSNILANLQAQCENFNKLTNPPPPMGMVSVSARDFGSPSSDAQVSISNLNSGSIEFKSRSLTMKEIMGALKDDQICIVGLCGMAGVGKTTMVEQVERATKAEKLFDWIAKVTVSQQLDIIKIQTVIAEYLGLQLPEQVSSDARADRVRERLRQSNKVLIILDDVWHWFDLEKIGIPMGTDHKGCKVILTSRSEDVCQKMRIKKIIKMQQLERDEAWCLFKKMADCSIDNLDIEDIARQIVKKCQGLPLALVTIGRALGGKDKCEWENALEQLTVPCQATLIGVHAEVYPSLLLSYNHIATEKAKLLFNLCCLFPEDYEIPIEELFRYGEGKQLFEGRNKLRVRRNYAFSLIKDLVRRHLLLEGRSENYVKMHDVVHEFGISILSSRIGKHVSLISHDDNLKQWPDKEAFENCACASLITNAMEKLPEGLNCNGLELLMLFHNNRTITLSKNFFKRMGALKILILRNMLIVMQAPSLGLLKNLQTLCIETCGKIDIITTIGELINLKILSFRDSDLHEIPEEIRKLTNLKLLDLTVKLEELYIRNFCNWEVEGEVERRKNASLNELEQLSDLNTLEIWVTNPSSLPRKSIFSNLEKYSIVIGEKKESHEDPIFFERKLEDSILFERKLELQQLNKTESSSSGIDMLFKKAELLTLVNLELEEIVGEAIQDGLHNLKYLAICKCKSTKSLEIRNCSLPKLTGSLAHLMLIEIVECHDLRNLFPLGIKEMEFPKLDTLEVRDLPKIQSLFSDIATYALFPNTVNIHCLLTLCIERMPNLTKIWDNKHYAGSCIKLASLKILGCQKIKNVITSSALSRLHELRSLRVSDCRSLEDIVVVDQRDGEHTEEVDEIMFPALTSLKLRYLPNLKSFYDKRPPSSSTPILIQHHLFNKQVSFPNLSDLYLTGLDSIEEIWCNQLLKGSFHNIIVLIVSNCNKLQKVFPSFVATTTLQLRYLEVSNCTKMEEVLGKEENAEQGKSLLSKLSILGLENMSNLRRFCHMSHDWELTSLCEVKISECPVMKTFSPASVNTPCLTHLLVTDEFDNKAKRVWMNNINDTLMYMCKRNAKGLFTHENEPRPWIASSSCTNPVDPHQPSMVKVKASLKTRAAWSYPPPGWVKLNSHTTCYSYPVVGGVLRQDDGTWVIGFTGMLDMEECDILTAKLWAIRQGLEIAWERRIPALVVETNSVKAIHLIEHAEISDDSLEIESLVKDCRVLIRERPWQCVIQYNRRGNANRAARYLVDTGREASPGVISILNDPPPDLLKILNEDTKEEEDDDVAENW